MMWSCSDGAISRETHVITRNYALLLQIVTSQFSASIV
jgi:hypothetical protein